MLRVHHETQHAFIGRALRYHLHACQHGSQQIVEVVRHAAGKLTHRLHLLRLRQRGFRLFALQHLALQPRGTFRHQSFELLAAFRQRLPRHHAVVDVSATAEPANDPPAALITHRQRAAGKPAMPTDTAAQTKFRVIRRAGAK